MTAPCGAFTCLVCDPSLCRTTCMTEWEEQALVANARKDERSPAPIESIQREVS